MVTNVTGRGGVYVMGGSERWQARMDTLRTGLRWPRAGAVVAKGRGRGGRAESTVGISRLTDPVVTSPLTDPVGISPLTGRRGGGSRVVPLVLPAGSESTGINSNIRARPSSP